MSKDSFLKKYRPGLFPGTPFSHRAMTGPNNNTPTEDTRIRREINTIIRAEAKNGKSMQEIELKLGQEYPERKEYITLMIDQYFNKTKGNER